jgi:hypothetical protein
MINIEFALNDNIDDPIEMHDTVIPPTGAHVELNGKHYIVEHVAIRFVCPVDVIETFATVWLSTHPDLG